MVHCQNVENASFALVIFYGFVSFFVFLACGPYNTKAVNKEERLSLSLRWGLPTLVRDHTFVLVCYDTPQTWQQFSGKNTEILGHTMSLPLPIECVIRKKLHSCSSPH